MIRYFSKSRGFSLLESMMAVCLLSIVMGAMFYIFSVASTSWLKARKTIEVKESAQVTFTRLTSLIRSSSMNSVTIISYPTGTNNAISFLSALDTTTGKTEYTKDGVMFWKKYMIFYLADDGDIANPNYYKLMSKEVSLGKFINASKPYTSEEINEFLYPPDPNTSSGTGYNLRNYLPTVTVPPSTYISPPRVVSRNITNLTFTKNMVSLSVNIKVKTGKPLKPALATSPPGAEKLELEGIVILRND